MRYYLVPLLIIAGILHARSIFGQQSERYPLNEPGQAASSVIANPLRQIQRQIQPQSQAFELPADVTTFQTLPSPPKNSLDFIPLPASPPRTVSQPLTIQPSNSVQLPNSGQLPTNAAPPANTAPQRTSPPRRTASQNNFISDDFVVRAPGADQQAFQGSFRSPVSNPTDVTNDFPGTSDPVASDFGPNFQAPIQQLQQPPASLQLPTVTPIFASPATREQDGSELLSAYHGRAQSMQPLQVHLPPETPLPNGGRTWWTQAVSNPIGIGSGPIAISLDSLIEGALRNSPNIQVAATEPHIQKSTVIEEAGQFDWRRFLESNYDDLNDPIGNELTTGNNDDRFTQQEWSTTAGLRRRNRSGGETEVSQRLGYFDNNSQFLIPGDQGNARLELNYRQPLLRGRGTAVNEALIVLADIDSQSASDDFLATLQAHLLDVTATYWELVRARSDFLQRQKVLRSAKIILANLQGRANVDALNRQILRARSAVANREAEIARALASVKNAESQLRLLVNDPALVRAAGLEFTPIDPPMTAPIPVNMIDAISTALANRPEISQAIRDIRASNVRLGVARNDILPRLDLLVGTYVAGLDGDSDFVNAWVNQFRDGRPGFNVGFEYEFPVGNRTARAREYRRQWETTRALQQFRVVVETSLTEVELSVREVETTHREMTGRYIAMMSSRKETEFLTDRWQTLPGVDDSVTLLLEDLLDSQQRLADEEAALARAQTDYAIAIVQLKQSMGTLFRIN